jgi:hypothetical protein
VSTIGGIERADWNYTEDGGSVQQSEVQLPANNAELTAAMMEYSPETVHTWQKEGGFEANERRVQATRQAVVAEMPPEYRESFAQGYDALPASIREKVANGARLSPGHGPNAWAQRLDQIERSLTPSELASAEAWLKSLTQKESAALMRGLGKR